MSPTTEAAAAWRQLWLKKRPSRHQKTKRKQKAKNQKTQKKHAYNQFTLNGENLDEKDEETWGDDDKQKHPEVIRIASQNIRGLSPYKSGHKNHQVCNMITQRKFDVFYYKRST